MSTQFHTKAPYEPYLTSHMKKRRENSGKTKHKRRLNHCVRTSSRVPGRKVYFMFIVFVLTYELTTIHLLLLVVVVYDRLERPVETRSHYQLWNCYYCE